MEKINNSNAFVSLKDINKIYPNGVQAVYDFNIDINKNDFIVLVGPSGCGKSTTLRMIAGLEEITSGYLYIDDVLSNFVQSKDRDISMVFQNYALYPQMTVFDNIAFPLRSKKVKRAKESTVLKAWNQVLDILENRLNEYLEAVNHVRKKTDSFALIGEYVEEKLNICSEASKILHSYHILKKSDLDMTNASGSTLYEIIKGTANKMIAIEKALLDKSGLEVDEEYRLLKNGNIIYSYVKLSKSEIRKKVFEAARILDLGPYLDRRPKELSGGQMQRVALGRAIVRNTKLFLMDEPLSNLDAKLRVQMRSEIVRIHEQIGATTIYVTHDQTEAMTMATKIVVMSKGWVQQVGTPEDIYNNPKNIFVATFIGSPAMNIFNATYDNGRIVFNNGYSVGLSNDFVNKHNKYYEDKINDLNRMLATPDFKKLHVLKLIDEVLFSLGEQIDPHLLDKKIGEIITLSKELGCEDEITSLLSFDNMSDLLKEIDLSFKVNAKKKLLEFKEIVSEISDSYGKEALQLINDKLTALENINTNQTLSLYNDYILKVNKCLEIIRGLDDKSNKVIINRLEAINLVDKLSKNDKSWLLDIRLPLLTFEGIGASDIGKLHNAQVFTKDDNKARDDALYYQKPKKKKKASKTNVNMNSADVEFVNSLYDVAVKLLENCKDALVNKHPIRVGVRPENIHLYNEFDGEKTDKFTVNSEIVELLGSELLVHANWAGSNIISKISTSVLIKPHTDVELTLDKNKLLIFDEYSGDVIS